MKEFKGTSGSWLIDVTDKSIELCPDRHVITDELGGFICNVRLDFDNLNESEANAKLIAASKDLLEALQELYRITKKYNVGQEMKIPLYKYENKVFKKAEQAISKALD